MKHVEMSGPVVIFGGRGAGVLAAFTLARATGSGCPLLAGFLNDVEAHGSLIEGAPVLGCFADWSSLAPSTRFLAPLHKANEMTNRAARIQSLCVPYERWANVVDPAALVADGTLAGSGVWAQAGSAVMPSARIGSHVALRSGCHISHDCVIEDFVSVGMGVILCGYSKICQGAYLAPGAIVRDGVTIGCYSIVGLGAVVVGDVPDGAMVIGNPGRVVGMVNIGGVSKALVPDIRKAAASAPDLTRSSHREPMTTSTGAGVRDPRNRVRDR